MRLIAALWLASTVAASLLALPAPSAPPQVFRFWPPDALVDAASIHASKLSPKKAATTRFFSLAGIAPQRRLLQKKALGVTLNSLSTYDLISLPVEVPGSEGALLAFDVADLRDRHDEKGLEQLLAALEKLGELGSGRKPFPEPFFHITKTHETKGYRDLIPYEETAYDAYGRAYTQTRYRGVNVPAKVERVTALGPWLNRATAAGLAAITHSNFPIFEARWFTANALAEPRYHELLGLDDHEASAIKLAGADERRADRRGAQLRGAVLFSEVAHENRVLERTPTDRRQGRGVFQRSFDFAKSINLDDVLKDTLVEKADAHEIIFSLPNGLLGFYVSDGKGKRLDQAVADVAINRRRGWEDPQVRTAFMCIACHLPDRGWIEVDDEVRRFAEKPIRLKSLALDGSADPADRDRGRRIRQKYLQEDFNALLRADQALVEAAVLTATGGPGVGLTCAEAEREITWAVRQEIQTPVTLQTAAADLGVSQAELVRALEAVNKTAAPDHTVTGLLAGRKQRRDQWEAGGYPQVATFLYLGRKGK